MGKNSKRKRDKHKVNKKAPNVPVKRNHVTLGLAMIMKDEIEDLDRIINDYGKYFYKIYVTVTHKKTYDTLRKSAIAVNVELSYFKWIDHFGKARNYNLSQVTTDYWMWIDLDDEIEGAKNIRDVIEYMVTKGLDAVWFQYDYVRRVNFSEPGSTFWRERIVRTTSKLRWNDEPLHEHINVQADSKEGFLTNLVIKHRKTAEQSRSSSAERNRVILEKDWQQNHRAITAYHLGKDLVRFGDFDGAIEKLSFVTKYGESGELRFDAWRFLCECYFQTGKYDAALAAANEASAIMPDHPGPWYQKFAAYREMGQITAALHSAEIAMSKKIEGGLGVLLEQDQSMFQYKGPFTVAKAYLSIGNIERAYELYNEVKKIAPEYIEENSAATGVQWDAAFEQAYKEFKNNSQ
jgi:tetratricopeptide (TPR) repeat protein